MKMAFIIFLFFGFCCSTSYGESHDDTLQKFVDNERSKFNVTGLNLSILASGSEIKTISSGKKTINGRININENSYFQVGSITKTFTALLVARAIEKKQIRLDDNLGKFLPEYPKWKNIKIEQLVNQTSGIFDYIRSPNWWNWTNFNPKKIWRSHELVHIAYSHPDDFAAGTDWRYSNTNYVLLGMIMEKITGKSVTSLMSALFAEAKLNNTHYYVEPYSTKIINEMAHGYYSNGKDKRDVTSIHGSWLQAAGAAISTTSDIVKWGRFFYKNHAMVEFLQTSMPFDKTVYRFGTFRMNTPEGLIWFTPGLTSGYMSMMVYAPCLNLYFSYSATIAPINGFHKNMILGVLHQYKNNNQYIKFLNEHAALPAYCSKIKPTKEFQFPKIG